MNNFELDEVFGSVDCVAENLLPQREREAPVRDVSLSKSSDSMFTKGNVTLAKDYYVRQMRCWRAQGEKIETYIAGCDESIQDAVRELAKTEGFL